MNEAATLIALINGRIGQEFDGEATLSEHEARRVTSALEALVVPHSSIAFQQLHAIVDAWEALPGGKQVRNSDVEKWLARDMAPAINAIRGFLRRPRPDGVLPPPPSQGDTR